MTFLIISTSILLPATTLGTLKFFSSMTKYYLVLILSFLTIYSFEQSRFKPDEAYSKHSSRAYKFYEDKNYKQSALSYDTLFYNNKGQGLRSDKYNAACSWALSDNIEKAFEFLNNLKLFLMLAFYFSPYLFHLSASITAVTK